MAATAQITDEQALRDMLGTTGLDEGEEHNWANILVYGDVGAGKTHLLGTAADHPETSPVVIFDIEGGLKTLKKFPNKKNITRKPIRKVSELEKQLNILYKGIKTDKLVDDKVVSCAPYIPGVRTVGIDSLTELADVDMKDIMKLAYANNPDKVDIDVPSMREWGKTRNHIRNIVRFARDLPCNVVFTAHAGSLQDEGQPTKYFPGFSGKLRTEVPGFMDIVGYLSTKNDGGAIVRTMQVLGTNRVVAKDRFGNLAEDGLLRDPTMPLIWQQINS